MTAFKYKLPLSVVPLREFELSVIKLVENSTKVSIKQMCRHLGKKYDDFADLANGLDSLLARVIKSKAFM